MNDSSPFQEPEFWYAIIAVLILGVIIGVVIGALT